MKFKDLTEEQQEHFKKVVNYCQENGLEKQLEEATHIDAMFLEASLTRFVEDMEYFFDWGGIEDWVANRNPDISNLYEKPEDYRNISEGSNEHKTVYKLKIIYKNNSEPMTLNFTEELKDSAIELFNLIKRDLVALSKGEIGYSIISSDVAFAIDVSEIASVFLNEVEDET